MIALFLLVATAGFGQQKTKYIPEKGHWQLVSNIKDPRTVTVQFYNEEGVMIYEETLYKVKMNPDRKKVRRHLYYALQEAYTEWVAKSKVQSNNLVAKRN